MVLNSAMARYFSYQVIEIIVVAAICVIQLQFIKRMFKSSSILWYLRDEVIFLYVEIIMIYCWFCKYMKYGEERRMLLRWEEL